jgi:hypothetical protein
MRRIDSIVEDVADIYHTSGKDAEEYLYKARKLKEEYVRILSTILLELM